MRNSIKEFVQICNEFLPLLEPIYDFGSRQGPAQIGWADLRPYFSNKKYIGADMQEGSGVDVILDLHKIDLASESVGTVLCLETLEHIEFPRKAFKEVYRILKRNGIFIVTSATYFPIHYESDKYSDYWRFTPMGFESLFKDFASSYIDYVGQETLPHTVLGIGFKENSIPRETMDKLLLKIKFWRGKWSDPQYPWGH